MSSRVDIAYLGRARLHRSRANLIQSLHTVAAFTELGWVTRLYLPPWPRSCDLGRKLEEMGLPGSLDVQASRLLHPRWGFWPFVRWRRRELESARVVYTRVPTISIALASAGIRHHLEVHDTKDLGDTGLLSRVVGFHRSERIGWLIPISRAAATLLIEAGAVAERVHVAPSGVALEVYASLPPFNPTSLDRPRLVHLGRLSEDRGLRIFEHLAVLGIARITIVGGGDVQVAGAENYGVVPLSKVPEWYGRSDMTLLPYQPMIQTAGTMSPIKLFEAMAAGRPIIASDLPTIREVIEHERTGLLVAADDVGAWAAAVERLRSDRALAVRMALNARAEAAKYSWSARARGIAEAIGLDQSRN